MIKQQLSARSEELSRIISGVCVEDSGVFCHDRKGFEREYKTLALSLTLAARELGKGARKSITDTGLE